jgi:hypothetical protein
MGHLWDALSRAYDVLGFDEATGGDQVFRQLVLARIIEPTSKLDSLRVLEEVGITPASYPTVNRRLPVYSQDTWRQGWPRRARVARRCGRRRWCSTTSPPCTSRPTPVTGSVSRGSPRSDASSRRSLSGC